MYFLGKAKSLSKADWLWRGICAIPRPLINKRWLRIAPRTMATVLRLVTRDIVGHFLVHRVSKVNARFWYLDRIEAKYITAIGRKDQLTKIQQAQIVGLLKQALQWLTHSKRRRASELIWSIHREHRKLDEVVKGA